GCGIWYPNSTHNAGVEGSSPSLSTNKNNNLSVFCLRQTSSGGLGKSTVTLPSHVSNRTCRLLTGIALRSPASLSPAPPAWLDGIPHLHRVAGLNGSPRHNAGSESRSMNHALYNSWTDEFRQVSTRLAQANPLQLRSSDAKSAPYEIVEPHSLRHNIAPE